MKLQELINQTDLNMTTAQVKAFFLGTLVAEKPLSYSRALAELLTENPENRNILDEELKKLWDELEGKKKIELAQFFPKNSNLREYFEVASEQLDFFLTALSLAGTTPDSCKKEELAEVLNELEEIVMELDEYLAGPGEEGEDLKELLVETWQELLVVV